MRLQDYGNRHKFNKVIAERIADTLHPFALCFMDLDGFKHINDNMGHDAGDELLIELGRRLEAGLDVSGDVYRLGGDEYALVINTAEKSMVEEILKRVQSKVEEPVMLRGNNIKLEYSLGVSLFPYDSTNSNELVSFADSAMYHVKEHGKNNYYFHNKALKSQIDNKKKLEENLKAALLNGEFGVDFQPRINLKNKDAITFETFLFWNNPKLGKLKAEYFIDSAASFGLIINIDEFVLEQSLSQIKIIQQKGYKNVSIAINMSLKHFERTDFVDRLCKILEGTKLEEGRLMFEITDTIDIKKIELYKAMIERIRSYGVKFSINNLEINYNILDLVKRLPVDEIKVSSEYLVTNSIFKPEVLKDIITLCSDLNYDVLVTKVEDERTFDIVSKFNVNSVQGKYIYEPISQIDILKFIEMYRRNR